MCVCVFNADIAVSRFHGARICVKAFYGAVDEGSFTTQERKSNLYAHKKM